jgi:hypothetical protein
VKDEKNVLSKMCYYRDLFPREKKEVSKVPQHFIEESFKVVARCVFVCLNIFITQMAVLLHAQSKSSLILIFSKNPILI